MGSQSELRAQTIRLLKPGTRIAVASDATSDPVLVCFATQEHTFLMTIAKSEYDFDKAAAAQARDAAAHAAAMKGVLEAAKAGKLGDGMAYTQSDKDYRDSLLKEANAGQARETSELLTSGALAGGLDEARGIVGKVTLAIKACKAAKAAK